MTPPTYTPDRLFPLFCTDAWKQAIRRISTLIDHHGNFHHLDSLVLELYRFVDGHILQHYQDIMSILLVVKSDVLIDLGFSPEIAFSTYDHSAICLPPSTESLQEIRNILIGLVESFAATHSGQNLAGPRIASIRDRS